MITPNASKEEIMTTKAIIEELTFTRCENWNTLKCPNKNTSAMGLSIINRTSLFLLNDDTVKELDLMCIACCSFYRYPEKISTTL